jgi:hypothetical protein
MPTTNNKIIIELWMTITNLLRKWSSLRTVMTVEDDVSLSLSLQLTSVPFSLISVGLIDSEYTRGRRDPVEKVNMMFMHA